MPTVKDKLHFNFDNTSSREFNVINVNIGSGLYEEQLIPDREIVETETDGSDTPIFHKVKETPSSFGMVLGFENKFTDEEIDDVILWLFQDYYKPLYFEDKPDKVMYCMAVGSPSIVHNGNGEGYIALEMRMDSTRIVSRTRLSEEHIVENTKNIDLVNNGHVKIYPEISIEKDGNGHIELINENAMVLQIRDLADKEKIYINCEKEIIESDIPGVYRYDDVTGHFDYLGLKQRRTTRIRVRGSCKIQFRYRFKYKF